MVFRAASTVWGSSQAEVQTSQLLIVALVKVFCGSKALQKSLRNPAKVFAVYTAWGGFARAVLAANLESRTLFRGNLVCID